MQRIYASPSQLVSGADLRDHLQCVVEKMRAGTTCTLLMFDLLGIETLRGDSRGDGYGAVLRQVVGLLSAVSRPGDTIARWSDSQFVLLLKDCTPLQALKKVRILHAELHGARFSFLDGTFVLRVGMGLTPVYSRYATAQRLLEHLSEACSASTKAVGRYLAIHDGVVNTAWSPHHDLWAVSNTGESPRPARMLFDESVPQHATAR